MQAATAAAAEVCIGPAELIPAGEGRAFCMGGESIAVFRQRDGSVYAISGACPHEGGPLADSVTGGRVVVCPLHSWKFDLATGTCLNDASQRVRTFPVREEDGLLWVTPTASP